MPQPKTRRKLPNRKHTKPQPPVIKHKPARRSYTNLWICLALLVATFAVYAQVRRFDFVNFDDPEYVANPHVRNGLTPDGIAWAFTSRDAANWFPLTRLSHELDCQLFGLNASRHHLTNVFIHAGAALLLFAFLFRATRARWPSAFVAFVFALHPLHVESVAWVAERKDVLCAFFWFLALWFYVRHVEHPGRGRYLLVLLAFVLGALSKPMIVTLPLVLLIVDYWPLKRPAAWKQKIPLFALAGALAVWTYFVQRASGAVRSETAFPVLLRIENAIVSYVVYVAQMFWPARLAVFYPYPQHLPIWQPLFAAAVLAGITICAFRTKRTHPYLISGWLWYLVTLLPVIGLVQVGSQARADRYMYIPMTGLSMMLAWGARDLLSHRMAAFAAAAACSCCAAVTFIQLGIWQNSETLYRHALAVTKGNYIAEHNLGTYLMDQPGRLPEAIEDLEAAVRMKPDSMEARTDLGSALAKAGRLQEAIPQYEAALRIQPNSPITLNDLANAVSQVPGRLPEAIADYKKALQIQPDYSDAQHNLAIAHENLGTILARQGRPQAAIAEYEAALPFEPNSAQLHYNLGLALSKTGRAAEAIEQFEAVLKLAPDSAEAHNNLGVLLSQSGRLPEAIAQFEAAIRANPNYAEAHYNLGMALSQTGRTQEALAHFEAAQRIKPDPETQQILDQLRAGRRGSSPAHR